MKKLYVVEGVHDVAKLKQVFPNINVVATNGTGVSRELLTELSQLQYIYDIVLVLDPDGPGEKIRGIIEREISNCQHIYVDRNQARSKNGKKVGVEHMSDSDLKRAFSSTHSVTTNETNITKGNLFELRLLGHVNSSNLRSLVGKELNLGYSNGSSFLRKINLFGISLETLERLVEKYER